MTISKAQLADAQKLSFESGVERGKIIAKQENLMARQGGIIDLVKAASELAQANAKLTYAMSRIADKLL